jgi:hypothetical protein
MALVLCEAAVIFAKVKAYRRPASERRRPHRFMNHGRPSYISKTLRITLDVGLRVVSEHPELDPIYREKEAERETLRQAYHWDSVTDVDWTVPPQIQAVQDEP